MWESLGFHRVDGHLCVLDPTRTALDDAMTALRRRLGPAWSATDRAEALSTNAIGHRVLYGQRMLTLATRLDVMNRLGRAMADPTRSRILMTLLEGPSYPAVLARDLDLTRSNVSNHLTCLRDCGIVVAEPEGRQTRYEIADPHLAAAMTALVEVTLAVDENAPCVDADCTVPGCCPSGTGA